MAKIDWNKNRERELINSSRDYNSLPRNKREIKTEWDPSVRKIPLIKKKTTKKVYVGYIIWSWNPPLPSRRVIRNSLKINENSRKQEILDKPKIPVTRGTIWTF